MHGFIIDFNTGVFGLGNGDNGLVLTVPSGLKEDTIDRTTLGHGLATTIHDR